MANHHQSKVDRLHKEGIKVDPSAPQKYKDVVENMSDDEVSTLIDVKKRLDAAHATGGEEHYSQYFVVPF